MPQIRVDFYLLTHSAEQTPWHVACRLLEKAYLRGHRVFVYCDNQQQAEHLDELLWTYKNDSFIPHHLQGEGPEPPPPIQIGYGEEPRGYDDILVNMATNIPSYFKRFRRIIEIVAEQDEAKAISRDHYREYRTQQCDLHTHNI